MELNFLFLDFYILSMSITNMITVIKNIKQFQIFIRYDTFGFRKLYINNSVDSVICQLPVFYRNQIKQIFVNKLYNFNGRYFFIYPCFELYRISTLTFLFIAFCMIITLPQIPTSSAYRRFIFISSLLSFLCNTLVFVAFLVRNTQQKSE